MFNGLKRAYLRNLRGGIAVTSALGGMHGLILSALCSSSDDPVTPQQIAKVTAVGIGVGAVSGLLYPVTVPLLLYSAWSN